MHANMQYALQHVFNLNPVRAKLGVRVPSIFPVRLHPALRSSLALARSLLFMSWIFSSSLLLPYIVGSFLPTTTNNNTRTRNDRLLPCFRRSQDACA